MEENQNNTELINEGTSNTRRKNWKISLTSVNVLVLTALIGLIGNAVVKFLDFQLEKEKFQSSLVLKSLEAGDTTNISKTLLFLINSGILEDKDSSIRKAAKNPNGLPNAPSLFNTSGGLPTITVSNTKNICGEGIIDTCWKQMIYANLGDTVAVQIYYENSSNTPSDGTTLGLSPIISSKTNQVDFRGGVASLTGPKSLGQATVIISSASSVVYIPGSARWYKTINEVFAVDEKDLFGHSGLNIGTVMPGTQGVLVAFFVISF